MTIDWEDTFIGRAAAASSALPFGGARDRSPGLDDGTPFVASWINDMAGFHQHMLSKAGITPSGNVDTAVTSQILEALRLVGNYPGKLCFHHWPTIPTGMRVLNFEGQAVLRSAYTDLDTACYCGDGNNATADAYFHANTGGGLIVRDIAGTHLILPDARGVFPRGIDPIGLRDPDAARLPGDLQLDALQKHNHMVLDDASVGFASADYGAVGTLPVAGGASPNSSATVTASAAHVGEDIGVTYSSVTGVGRVHEDETRPVNFACYIGVYY